MLYFAPLEQLKKHADRYFPEDFSRLPSMHVEYAGCPNRGEHLVRLENQVDVTYTSIGELKYEDSQLTHLKPFCWLTSGTDHEKRRKKDILLLYYISSKNNPLCLLGILGLDVTRTFRSACKEIADALQATKTAINDPTKWSITVPAQPQIQKVSVKYHLHAFL